MLISEMLNITIPDIDTPSEPIPVSKVSTIPKVPTHPIYINRPHPKKLTCFERVEYNLDWILYYLDSGWGWSSIAELLEMKPATLINYFNKLVPDSEYKRPVSFKLPNLSACSSDINERK